MGLSVSNLRPEELITFKKLPTQVPLNKIVILEGLKTRKNSDVKWLIFFCATILVLLSFLIYCMIHSDIKGLIAGYDNCGNICGQKNKYLDGVECSGKDYTDYPVPDKGKCLRNDHPEDNGRLNNLTTTKWQTIFSCLSSILVAIGMLSLLRFATAFVVWGILIISYVALAAFTIVIWFFQVPILATVLTICVPILGLGFIIFKKKIQLVILLLKQATIAIFHMPVLITIPLVGVVAILIIGILFILTTVCIISAAFQHRYDGGSYVNLSGSVVFYTVIYNFVVFIWSIQFVFGAQYMIIAGAVAKWYFARDKNFLESPILTSSIIACRYHLGTIALGSLIITIVQIIKIITWPVFAVCNLRPRWRCCCKSMDSWFKFLSEYAYIVTAIHGKGFIRSGKRAVRLLIQNLGGILAVTYIGRFVLGVAQLLIVLITCLLSVAIYKIAPGPGSGNVPPFPTIAVVSLLVASPLIYIVETAISTIFICYCEDVLLNNGMSSPYYMSRSLMEFVQRSKAIYGLKGPSAQSLHVTVRTE